MLDTLGRIFFYMCFCHCDLQFMTFLKWLEIDILKKNDLFLAKHIKILKNCD